MIIGFDVAASQEARLLPKRSIGGWIALGRVPQRLIPQWRCLAGLLWQAISDLEPGDLAVDVIVPDLSPLCFLGEGPVLGPVQRTDQHPNARIARLLEDQGGAACGAEAATGERSAIHTGHRAMLHRPDAPAQGLRVLPDLALANALTRRKAVWFAMDQ
jgi:hypothetical protein